MSTLGFCLTPLRRALQPPALAIAACRRPSTPAQPPPAPPPRPCQLPPAVASPPAGSRPPHHLRRRRRHPAAASTTPACPRTVPRQPTSTSAAGAPSGRPCWQLLPRRRRQSAEGLGHSCTRRTAPAGQCLREMRGKVAHRVRAQVVCCSISHRGAVRPRTPCCPGPCCR